MYFLEVHLSSNFINEFAKFVIYICILECDGSQESHINKIIDIIDILMVYFFFNFLFNK